MLRLSDQRYRTCLECLGQGKITLLASAITMADVLQGPPALQAGGIGWLGGLSE